MPKDTIRVFRLLEYTGPRKQVEDLIDISIHGTMNTCDIKSEKSIRIRAVTLGNYPEIMEEKDDA